MIEEARGALEGWWETDRVAAIEQFGSVLERRRDEMAQLISEETGKPLWESRQEVQAMLAKGPISIEAERERAGTTYKELEGVRLVTRHRPHGVVAVLGPFNFPGHLPTGQIIPALLAGNTLLFKPSDKCPRTGALLSELWQEVLPPHVLTLVQGGAEVGRQLADVADGLFFTGSSQVGWELAERVGPHRICALEMGGNNPTVVWECDHPESAAYHIALSAFATAGQRCTCTRRLILHRDDPLIEELIGWSQRLRVGHFSETPEPFMGPVISDAAADQLLKKQSELMGRGGQPLLEMRRLRSDLPLLSPGIIDMTGVDREDVEIFGPLLQVIRVESFEEAIAEASATRYGLSAALFGGSQRHYEEFRRRVRAGALNWNRPTSPASSLAPFGGVGLSGNYRPAATYLADSCAYPVASLEADHPPSLETLQPGIEP